MPPELRFGPFRLDRANQSLLRGGEEIALTPKSFAVLAHVAERPGRLVTKDELLDAIWGDTHVTDGALKRCVVEIRKALEDPANEPRYIQTLHGRGYRFLATNTPAAKTSAAPAPRLPVMVGREQEFESLNASFDAARRGARQVVFITGEAGLGKSTLVDHWLHELASRESGRETSAEWFAARGRCLQQFGSGEPYLPIFEMLEALSRSLGPRLVTTLRAHAPTWLLHMPSLISLQDRARLRDEVFGTSRERMLREMTMAIEELAASSPIVLVLEDLHWTDPSTIDLLTSIATRTSSAQLMIVATYRPSELGGTSHPLSRVQNELVMHGQCRVLPLSFLSQDDIREYLADGGAEPDADETLTASLHRRTNGNPLFVSCVVDELVRSGGMDAERVGRVLPATLQNMFEHQSDQLSEAERDLVDAAAVEGELFSTASIAAALNRDQAALESTCESLVKRHVLLKRAAPVRFPDGAESTRYSFLHVLCRDALYRRLPPMRQSRLHGLLGRATETLYASDPAKVSAELAGHYELAGEFARAIRHLRLAADGAASRFANREAMRHLERAIHLIDKLSEGDRASLRMDLLEQRALMRLSTMDLEGSAEDFAAVDSQAQAEGNVNRRVKALLDSVMPWGFLNYRRCLGVIEEAQLLAPRADPVLAALADAYRSGVWIYFFGWKKELEEMMDRAAPVLAPVTDLWTRSRFLWMDAFVRGGASDYAAAVRSAEDFRHLARRAGIFHQYFLATHNFLTGLINIGDLGRAMRTAKEDVALAQTNHHILEQLWFESQQAAIAIEAFDFERALEICARLVNEPTMMRFNLSPHVLLWLGMARLGTGAHEEASEAFERLSVQVAAGGVGAEYRYPLLLGQAKCSLARGERDAARELAGRSVRLAEEHSMPAHAARGLGLLAEIASEDGDLSAASEHITAAIAALKGRDIPNVEWQVHATAAEIFAKAGRGAESESARAHSIEVGKRVGATLAGEPALQKSLLDRVLGARAGVSGV